MHKAEVESLAFDAEQLELARHTDASARNRHEAKLNFGDCFGYALARRSGEPLLFVGTDFGLTDVAAIDLQRIRSRIALAGRQPPRLSVRSSSTPWTSSTSLSS